MDTYSKTFEATWADMDPNRHMRHSVYNDYAAHARVGMFSAAGYSIEQVANQGIGPILFREETHFLREIHLMDILRVTCAVHWMNRDGSRWSMAHEIFKEVEGTEVKAAEITVDGGWLFLEKRKLIVPPEDLFEVMEEFPRTEEFEWKE